MCGAFADASGAGLDGQGWWRDGDGGEAGERQQDVVGVLEDVDVGFNGAIGGGDEEAGVCGLIERDVSKEASAAAGLFDDSGGIAGREEVHPAEADSGGRSRVVEAGLANEIGGVDVDGLGNGVLGWKISAAGACAGAEKILEPEGHVGGGGVDACAGDGVLGVGAGAFVVRALKEAVALRGIGCEAGFGHAKGRGGALGEEGGVGLAGGLLESVAEEIEADVGVEGLGAGRIAEALRAQPVPAVGVAGKGEVRGVFSARCAADFAGKAGGVGCEVF